MRSMGSQGFNNSSGGTLRLWSDLADAQTDFKSSLYAHVNLIICILGQVWYITVWIADRCPLSYLVHYAGH